MFYHLLVKMNFVNFVNFVFEAKFTIAPIEERVIMNV